MEQSNCAPSLQKTPQAQWVSLQSSSCLALTISPAPSPASLPSSSRHLCCSPCLCTCCSLFLECHSFLSSYFPTSSVLKASSNAASSVTSVPPSTYPYSDSSRLPAHCSGLPQAHHARSTGTTFRCCPSPNLSSSVACPKSSLSPPPRPSPSTGKESRCVTDANQSSILEPVNSAGQTSTWLQVSIRPGHRRPPDNIQINPNSDTPKAYSVPSSAQLLQSLPSCSQHTGKFTQRQS